MEGRILDWRGCYGYYTERYGLFEHSVIYPAKKSEKSEIYI